MDNLEVWNKVKTPPEWAIKKIEGGHLKGKSDINPQWRMQVMTEYYGQCGIGWKFTIEKEWTAEFEKTVLVFVKINLYVARTHSPDNVALLPHWSDPIPAIGGDFLVEQVKDKNGTPYSSYNDDAYKMATTDALGKAMTALGVAADVYNGSKYERIAEKQKTQAPQQTTPPQNAHKAPESQPGQNVPPAGEVKPEAKSDPFRPAPAPKRDYLLKQIENARKAKYVEAISGFVNTFQNRFSKMVQDFSEKEATDAIAALVKDMKTFKKDA